MIALVLASLLAPAAPPAPTLVGPPPSATVEPEAPAYDPAQLRAALARLPTSPSLAQVQDAALAHAGVDPLLASRWLRRARTAAALPTVSVQYDRRFDRGWTLDQEVGEADALRNDAGNQDLLRAKALLQLGEAKRGRRHLLEAVRRNPRDGLRSTSPTFASDCSSRSRACTSSVSDSCSSASSRLRPMSRPRSQRACACARSKGCSPDSRASTSRRPRLRTTVEIWVMRPTSDSVFEWTSAGPINALPVICARA